LETLGLTDPVDFESDVPVHGQIANRLKFAIARGAYAPNSQLPSVRALAKGLLVNPNTVIRVYNDLENEGLIYSHPGKGVFVSAGAQRRCRRDRLSIVEEKLTEALALARRAELEDAELEELWMRLKKLGEGS
jgi:GntR family transcriptional regulator